MKKSKILRLFLTFICLIAISLVGNNVYGYQLKYKAVPTNNGKGALVRTYGNTYGYPPSNFKYGTWIENVDNSFRYREGSYRTYKIVFHNQLISNYLEGWKSNGSSSIDIGYDKSKRTLTTDDIEASSASINLSNQLETRKATVTGQNDSVYQNGLHFDRGSEDFYESKVTYLKLPPDPDRGLTNQTITVSDWYISKNAITKVMNKWLKNNGSNEIYFSLAAKTGNIYTVDDRGDWYSSYKAADYIVWYNHGGSTNGWAAENRGINDVGSPDSKKVGSNRKLASAGQSAINLFDNILVLPTEFYTPQEVYIRHVDSKGNLLDIANSSEIKVTSDGKQSIINNSGKKTVKKSDKTNVEYQEYYKINLGEKLQVSRSLTMASNGKMYKYKNAIVSSAKTAKAAADNDNINKNSNKKSDSSFQVGGNSADKAVTVVTFIYDEADVPGYPPGDDDPPSGDIHTEFSSDDNSNACIQKYTTTDTNVKPYLKTNRILLKDLKYKLEKNGDTVKYKIEHFNVQQLIGGKIDDNPDVPPESTGNIFGEENYTLFNSDTSHILTVTSKSKEASLKYASNFKNSNNNGKLPSQSSIDSFVKNENNKSTFSDFDTNENNKYIPLKKYNGVRNPKLSANYQAINVMNDGKATRGSIGYRYAKNKVNIIVYNPLELDTIKVTSKEIIDHTPSSSKEQNVIQKNADFTVSFGTKGSSQYATITDTSNYLDYYYLIFDIDVVLKSDYQVKKRTDNGFTGLQTISSGSKVEAGSLIKINKGDKEFNAIASSNEAGKDIVSQVQNNVILIGVTNNMPSEALENLIFSNAVKKYVVKNDTIEEKYINTTISTNRVDFVDYCDANYENKQYHEKQYTSWHDMYSDAYYFAMARAETTNVGRIYDFKVTDCSDIDYKSVFRKSSGANNINDLTGVQYFSGVKLFNIYTNEINSLDDRGEINISGSSAKKILPLGPYKNTNTSYVNAPKMGYRISFDLKTSGFFDGQSSYSREILIQPSYYYISKDGTNFDKEINLYYKNSDGKYEKFSGSDYTIYFKPKDGYRSVANSVTAGNTSGMSEQLEPLAVGSTSGFTLNSKMMSTADNNFIQAWYGEFKLPNSIIAVKGSDVSKPYTNGYIGVVFKITSIDKDSNKNIIRELSYNQNNNNADEDKKDNTTQWDYEGYLGFTNYGNKVDSITLQLEKGEWKIDDSRYQEIKGTVVLYDTDNRASNDFD